MPRDEGTYYLDTDASDVRLGAVLSQDQDRQEVVFGYASRILSRTERNYDVTRRELLTIVYGLKTYRQYLLGRQFIIRTDHSALQPLRQPAEPIGQQARWQTLIERFSFVMMHCPGTKHKNADALSRRPFDKENDNDRQDRVQCAKSKVSKNQQSTQDLSQALAGKAMSELQQQDSDIGPILRLRIQQTNQPQPEEILSASEMTKVLWRQWQRLVIRDDVLYRALETKHGRQATLQLIVPSSKRTEFIQQCHEGMTGGHRAFQATLNQVQRRGFWPGWRRDVQRYCRQCVVCSSYHRSRLPRSGPLQPVIVGTTMERCHVDITGPHPRTSRCSKYILTCVDAFSK